MIRDCDWDSQTSLTINGQKYHYLMWRDFEEDNVKNFHEIYKVNEDETYLNLHLAWTPYGSPSKQELITWVNCGCPTRKDNENRNFNSALLNQYAERVVTQALGLDLI